MDTLVIFLLGYILGTHIVFLAFARLLSNRKGISQKGSGDDAKR